MPTEVVTSLLFSMTPTVLANGVWDKETEKLREGLAERVCPMEAEGVGELEGKGVPVRDLVRDREEVGVNPVLAVVVGEDERVGAVVRVLDVEALAEGVEPTVAVTDGELAPLLAWEALGVSLGNGDGDRVWLGFRPPKVRME